MVSQWTRCHRFRVGKHEHSIEAILAKGVRHKWRFLNHDSTSIWKFASVTTSILRLVNKILVGYVLLFIAVLSGADSGYLHQWVPDALTDTWWDKVGHVFFTGLLAVLANEALRYQFFKFGERRLLVGTLIVVVVISIEELLQQYLPTRSFEILDLAADLSGILVAECFARYRMKSLL